MGGEGANNIFFLMVWKDSHKLYKYIVAPTFDCVTLMLSLPHGVVQVSPGQLTFTSFSLMLPIRT